MSIFDRVQVLVSPIRHMRGVATLTNLYPDRREPYGLNHKGEPATGSMVLRSLGQMRDTEFDREPHFSFYNIVNEDGEPLERTPRLQKVALGQVREQRHDVVMWGVGIDFDLKDHAPFQTDSSIPKGERGKITWDVLTEEQRESVTAVLNKASEHVAAQGMPWNYAHSSNGGVHFIHVLAVPVPAGVPFETLAAQVREAYVAAGLQVDASCKDWTRLFKCPRVTLKDGEYPVWEQDWFWEVDQEDDFLVPTEEDLTPAASDAIVIVASSSDFERPSPEDARGEIEELSDGGKMKLTSVGKKAKKALRDADCDDIMPAIFDAEFPIATENRHTALLAATGRVIAAIHGFEWANAELIYGLLHPAAEDLGLDDNGLPFVDQLWENCTSFWGREEAKSQARQAEQQVKKEIDLERIAAQDPAVRVETADPFAGQETGDISAPPLVDTCAFDDNVRLWMPDAEEMTHAEIITAIQKRKLGIIIDQKRDNCHVLMPNGFYDAFPCSSNIVRKVIEERGMEWIVPVGFWKENEKGDEVKMPYKFQKIIDESARTFANVDFTLRHGGSHLRVDEHGRGILNLVPFGLRQDLIDTRMVFDECIEWLVACVEDGKGDAFLKAIAYLAAIYWGPTAAVALIGKKGTGKSMLGLALADMVTTRRVVPGDVVMMKHNDAMLWSPFIHIDEGLKKSGDGIDFGDAFRRIVSGGPIALEPKNMPLMRCAGIHRVLITANNTDTLVKIAGTQARAAEDWEAISERLAVFHAQERAAEYLNVRGGMDFTASWVGPGSEHRLARTILAILYDDIPWDNGRPCRMGTRFLYEGNADEALIQDMEAEAKGIPEVVRAINKLLDRSNKPAAALHEGRLYVMCERVVTLASDNTKLAGSEIRAALRSLLDPEQPNRRLSIGGTQQRWRAVDLERFIGLLDRIGEPPAKAFTNFDPKVQEEMAKHSKILKDKLK